MPEQINITLKTEPHEYLICHITTPKITKLNFMTYVLSRAFARARSAGSRRYSTGASDVLAGAQECPFINERSKPGDNVEDKLEFIGSRRRTSVAKQNKMQLNKEVSWRSVRRPCCKASAGFPVSAVSYSGCNVASQKN
jgi:hypothetical protein